MTLFNASTWNSFNDALYHVRDNDILWNQKQQDLVHYQTTEVASVPILFAVATDLGVARGIASSTLWISLWGHVPSDAHHFVEGCIALCLASQKTKLMFGGDEFHFFPGIPVNQSGGLLPELRKKNFEFSEVSDFVGDLDKPEVASYIQSALDGLHNNDWSFVEAQEEDQITSLQGFLQREFPGRWSRELAFWIERTDIQRAFWGILKNADDQIIGFGRMSVRNRLLPITEGWTPAALRTPNNQDGMFQVGDGSLGPIGVMQGLRGQGAGRVLLGVVLDKLIYHYANRICIDWTNAMKYYEPLGFERARNYVTAWTTSLK